MLTGPKLDLTRFASAVDCLATFHLQSFLGVESLHEEQRDSERISNRSGKRLDIHQSCSIMIQRPQKFRLRLRSLRSWNLVMVRTNIAKEFLSRSDMFHRQCPEAIFCSCTSRLILLPSIPPSPSFLLPPPSPSSSSSSCSCFCFLVFCIVKMNSS